MECTISDFDTDNAPRQNHTTNKICSAMRFSRSLKVSTANFQKYGQYGQYGQRRVSTK